MDTVVAVLIIILAVVFVARMIRVRLQDRKRGGCGCDGCNASACRPAAGRDGKRRGGDDACD